MYLGGRAQPLAQGFGGLRPRPSAGHGVNGSPRSLGKGPQVLSQASSRGHVEAAQRRCPTDQQGDVWMRGVTEQIRPALRRLRELSGDDPIQGREGLNPIGMGRQVEVSAGHGKIEMIRDVTTLAAEVDETGPAPALFLDPTGHGGEAPACGDDEVGPGWCERSRA